LDWKSKTLSKLRKMGRSHVCRQLTRNFMWPPVVMFTWKGLNMELQLFLAQQRKDARNQGLA
jgi:hypothetical protein